MSLRIELSAHILVHGAKLLHNPGGKVNMPECIKDKINSHLYTLYPNLEEVAEVFEIDPGKYIWDIRRFDLATKYVFLSERRKAHGSWFHDIYYEHIKAFSGGSFKEGDGLKDSFVDFLSNLELLINKFEKENFNNNLSYIPISNQTIIDGSHRVSLAAFYQKKLKAITLNSIPEPNYSYQFFRENQQPSWVNDYVYLQRVNSNPNIRIIHINPKANITDAGVLEILKKHNTIVEYTKEITLKKTAFRFIVREYYKNERWIGDYSNKFAGITNHATQSWKRRKSLRVFYVLQPDLEVLNKIKSEIRQICDIGNFSVHINDTYSETRRLSDIFLNDNCIDFLNHILPNNTFWNFDKFLKSLKNTLPDNDEDFIFVGSLPLTLIGLRNNRDFDIITKDEHKYEALKVLFPEIDNHNNYLSTFNYNTLDILYDPRNYFKWQGYKFLSLAFLWKFKKRRNETKDKIDFIIQVVSRVRFPLNYSYLYTGLQKITYLFNRMHIINILRRIKKLLYNEETKLKLIHFLSFNDGRIKFKNHILYFPKGYTIIERYFKQGYEPELINHISNNPALQKKITFIDVGANIGLLSSLLLEKLDIKNLFLFEPGNHQFKFLERSFKPLEKATVYNVAVGSTTQIVDFYVHHPIHTSGDGIVDTQRAGKTKKVKVNQVSLDNWWQDTGQPKIDLLKIDVEGYEYNVLLGARILIQNTKPEIYLEINPKNLKHQSHTLTDLLKLLKEFNYEVFDLDNNRMEAENDFQASLDDNFYARPQ
ncbi:FkbM family methyltransferase [Pedobacter sp. BS3]|uniref:FkbM family methyltransferase n=1 Tax=Pedobacter sp. BS3 TaxID=2567937 RepID=UPI0016599FDA|nr:FkbM family methyltransferase [Pedobacter sp. BS3]